MAPTSDGLTAMSKPVRSYYFVRLRNPKNTYFLPFFHVFLLLMNIESSNTSFLYPQVFIIYIDKLSLERVFAKHVLMTVFVARKYSVRFYELADR